MADSALQPFQQAVDWREDESGLLRGAPAPDWGQGRATHGGLVGAIALRAMQRRAPAGRAVRSMTATFVGPLLTRAATCRTQLLREGKSFTVLEARIEQEGEVCCVAHAVFAGERSSIVELAMRAPGPLAAPDAIAPIPYVEGAMPAFLQHARLHWAFGNPPFSGTELAPVGGYCEWIGDAQPDACSVLALLDAWPTPAHSPMTAPSGASTVSWSIDFVADIAARAYATPFRYEGVAVAARHGHVQQDAWLWDRDGAPLARGRQLVAIFG
jgi:acyl-CoA thioesterase